MNSAQRKPLDGVFGNEQPGWITQDIDDLKFADLQVSHGLVLNDALNNIRIGTDSLKSNTGGTLNISFGYKAMEFATSCEDCTALGQQAMQFVTGLTAHKNVALGVGALQFGLNPVDVVALGTGCCNNTDDITSSVVIGNKAVGNPLLAPFYNATSVVAIGTEAGYSGPGSYSTICGHQAGYSAMLGSVSNSIYGFKSGYSLTTADTCTLIGTECGYGLTTGGVNNGVLCAVGYRCGYSTNADYCTYVGSLCCGGVGGGGNYNTAIGYKCLYSMQTATNNFAGGYSCGEALLAGTENVLLGSACVQIATTGSRNCIIGSSAAQYMGDGVNDWVIVGTNACKGSVGSPWTAVGSSVVIGKDCCLNIQGVNNAGSNVAIGTSCLKNVNTLLTSTVAIGNSAGENVFGSTQWGDATGCHVLIGESAGKGSAPWTAGPCVFIGFQAGMNVVESAVPNSLLGNGHNVGIGYRSLYSLIDGYNNVCLGDETGCEITQGTENVCIGNRAGCDDQSLPLAGITTGIGNVCIGQYARTFLRTGTYGVSVGAYTQAGEQAVGIGLWTKATGTRSVGIGQSVICSGAGAIAIGNATNALDYAVAIGPGADANFASAIAIGNSSKIAGSLSICVGYCCGSLLSVGSSNTIMGQGAGTGLTSGAANLILGINTGLGITTGVSNVCMGNGANAAPTGTAQIAIGLDATAANYSTCVGHLATSAGYQHGTCIGKEANILANYGTAVGFQAQSNESGFAGGRFAKCGTGLGGVAVGQYLGKVGMSGNYNCIVGSSSGNAMTSGAQNVIIGRIAGNLVTTGSNNIVVGFGADIGAAVGSCVCIGHAAAVTGANGIAIGPLAVAAANVVRLGNTGGGYTLVAGGAVWTFDSDERWKQNTRKTDSTSVLEFINDLELISYNHTRGNTRRKNIGLSAQQVRQALAKHPNIENDIVHESDYFDDGDLERKTPKKGLSVAYGEIHNLLIVAIQQLAAKVKSLEQGAKVAQDLAAKVESLEAAIAKTDQKNTELVLTVQSMETRLTALEIRAI